MLRWNVGQACAQLKLLSYGTRILEDIRYA